MPIATPEEALALARKGKLIEAGWEGYCRAVLPAGASPTQIRETRFAFFAGVKFLLSTFMSAVSEGPDETDEDLAIFAAIETELETFHASLAPQLRRN